MRIAIEYTAAIQQSTGTGAYVRNLVTAMLAQDPNNRYTLLTSGHLTSQQPFPLAENVRSRRLFISDRHLNILWYRWHAPIPATLFSGPVDIYHGPNFTLPPLGKKVRKVVTVHDLTFLERPEYAVPSQVTYLSKVVPASVAAADIVVVASQHIGQVLNKYLHVPKEKQVVVPAGVSPYFRPISDPVLLEATRYKFGLKSPLVLNVGPLEPRKNHLGLIKAFHQAQKRKNGPAMLAIVGGKGWLYPETQQLVAELKLERKVRFLGPVSDYELITLYNLATIFAFPSFFEGFGIPAIEAMACGTPVITSNSPALAEVVGDAALRVDPTSVNELATAMQRLLDDEQLRADLCQKGYQRAQQFTWEISARKMLAVYKKLNQGFTDFTEEVANS